MRYTPSSASVNSTRLRRSLTANRFFSAFSIVFPARTEARPLPFQDLRAAPRGGNLLRRLAAELVRTHRQLLRDVAPGQHLDGLPHAVDQAALAQQIGRHHRSGVEAIRQQVEIDHRVLGAKRVVKPALRHPAVQRHLAAFESALELVARPRLRTLVAAPRLGALTGAMSAPDALLV